MGRRKLYQTEEARKAAHAASQRKYVATEKMYAEKAQKSAEMNERIIQRNFGLLFGITVRNHKALLNFMSFADQDDLGSLHKRIALKLHQQGADHDRTVAFNLAWDELEKTFVSGDK